MVWTLPASVAALGALQRAPYEGAGPWGGRDSCGGSFKPGARDLRAYILRNFPAVSRVGGYACRPNTADEMQLSVHSTGRAIDVHTTIANGDVIANWLVANASAIGVQYVIWNRMQWSPRASRSFRPYTGRHPHTDHIHVELTSAGANRATPFFRGMIDSPPTMPWLDQGDSPVPTVFGLAGLGAIAYGLYKTYGKRWFR